MTGLELLNALAAMPRDALDGEVLVEVSAVGPDAPLVGAAMTGPHAGVLLLTTQVDR